MKVWIVSLVKRGFIQEPEILYSASEAERRKAELLNDFNHDYDEIAVFEKRVMNQAPIAP